MNTKEYINWICTRPRDGFSVQKISDDRAVIESANSEGEVTVYHLETDIIEMRLSRKKDHENYFFLHFELKDDEHAKGLCDEMFESLRKMENRTSVRVLLSCTSGFTTSFFASKLNEAAATLSVDYEFDAVAYAELCDKGFDYSVICLAPQIGFHYKKVKEIFAEQTVINIPAAVFASYDAGALITLIQQELQKKKETKEQIVISEVLRDVDLNALMFVVNITQEPGRVRYIERLYEAGKDIITEEVIKENFTYEDITDILDTGLRSLRKNWDVDAVSVSVPGHYRREGNAEPVSYTQLSEDLSAHCGLPVYAHHNTAAVAYGYYAQQGKYDIVSYHSQPRGTLLGGQGCVYRGMPIDGKCQRGGELGALFRCTFPEYAANTEEAASRERIMEVMVHNLIANIAMIAPEVILIRSELFPDMEEIRNELRKYIADEYIPDLIHVRDIREYALLGTLLYGMRRYKANVRELVKDIQE